MTFVEPFAAVPAPGRPQLFGPQTGLDSDPVPASLVGTTFGVYLKNAAHRSGSKTIPPPENLAASSSNMATGTPETGNLEQKRLAEVCQQFESLFVFQMLQAMRATVPEGGLFGTSMGQSVYKSMLDEQYALAMAKTGSMGIAKAMYDRLSKAIKPDQTDNPAPISLGPS